MLGRKVWGGEPQNAVQSNCVRGEFALGERFWGGIQERWPGSFPGIQTDRFDSDDAGLVAVMWHVLGTPCLLSHGEFWQSMCRRAGFGLAWSGLRARFHARGSLNPAVH